VPGDGLLYGFGPPARVWSLDRRPDVCAKALEIELEFTGVEMADRIADGAVGRPRLRRLRLICGAARGLLLLRAGG
jgi:hypothetical protein